MNPNMQTLVLRYVRYVDWARRSGYAPLDWQEYKRLRLANGRTT